MTTSPEYEDSKMLSLSKKAESLENQLKASELEHARYVMLGRYDLITTYTTFKAIFCVISTGGAEEKFGAAL